MSRSPLSGGRYTPCHKAYHEVRQHSESENDGLYLPAFTSSSACAAVLAAAMHFALSALHHRVLEALLRTGWIPFSTTGANVLHTIMAEHIPCFMCYKIYFTHSLTALANIPDEAYAACGFLGVVYPEIICHS